MSGETEQDVSGWTIDTLRYALSQRIDDLTVLLDERKANSDKAIDAALESVNKRLEGMNEFRATLSDQSKAYITRQEYDSAHEALVERVGELASRIDRAEGNRSGLNAGWVYMLGGIAALGTIISLLIAFR